MKKIKQKLDKVKGLTKDQLATLMAMPPTTLQVVINQLSTLVMGEDIDESLWANIHNKRKRGEKDEKTGEEGSTGDKISKEQEVKKSKKIEITKKNMRIIILNQNKSKEDRKETKHVEV